MFLFMNDENLIKLIQDSIFLKSEKKKWFIENLKNMTIFQKNDLVKLIVSSQNNINYVINKAKKIDNINFWIKFKEFKRKLFAKTYKEQEASEITNFDYLLSEIN